MALLSSKAKGRTTVGRPPIEKIRNEVISTIVGEVTGNPDLVDHDSLNRYRWRLESDQFRVLRKCAEKALDSSGCIEDARAKCIEMSEKVALEEADLLREGIAKDLNLDVLPVDPDREKKPLAEGRWHEEVEKGLEPRSPKTMASIGAHAIGRGVVFAFRQSLADAHLALAQSPGTAA